MLRKKTHVVVAGCGFAGAKVARELARLGGERLRVTAFNPQPYLYNYPILPRTLTEPVPVEHISIPLERFFGGAPVELQRQRIEAVDARRNIVITQNGETGFDYLILALGARAKPLERDEDAIIFFPKSSRRLGELKTLLRKIAVERNTRPFRFAVVGGGLTGIEFVAALSHAVAFSGLRGSGRQVEIHLFERDNEIAPQLPTKVGAKIASYLEEKGVEIHSGVTVERVLATHELVTSSGTMSADATLCCIGSQPNTQIALKGIGAHHGSFRVNNYLQLENHQNIFALGDNMELLDGGNPPGLHHAKQALRQGALTSRNILRHIEGRPLLRYAFKAGITIISLAFGTSALVWGGRTIMGKPIDFIKRRLEMMVC
jgi:NADH dehydrogenase